MKKNKKMDGNGGTETGESEENKRRTREYERKESQKRGGEKERKTMIE